MSIFSAKKIFPQFLQGDGGGRRNETRVILQVEGLSQDREAEGADEEVFSAGQAAAEHREVCMRKCY